MDESKEVLMKVIIGNINWRLVPGEVNSSVLESRVIHSWGQARHYPKLAWLLADDASALVPFTLDAVVFLLTPDELSFVAGASDVVERKFIQYLSKCWADCEIEGSLKAQLFADHMALKKISAVIKMSRVWIKQGAAHFSSSFLAYILSPVDCP